MVTVDSRTPVKPFKLLLKRKKSKERVNLREPMFHASAFASRDKRSFEHREKSFHARTSVGD